MKSKKGLLEKSRLYLIIDKKVIKEKPIFSVARKIKGCPIDIIQLRDKESKKEFILSDAFVLRKLFSRTKTIFIINDYLDIAKIVDTDGVHLGQEDASIEIARRVLGQDKIIGVSCHNLKQAIEAEKKGADYIGIGPLFSTPTKPESKPRGLDLIRQCKKIIKIPFFAIGGINLSNINQVLLGGAERVAICSAICQARNISLVTRGLSKAMTYPPPLSI